MTSPMATSAMASRDSGCQVGSGATSKSTRTSPDSAARSSRMRPSSGAQPFDRAAQDRQRRRRRVGVGQLLDLDVDLDRLAIALVALVGRVAVDHDPLGLAGLLEQAPALGQCGLGVGSPFARSGQRIAVALELGQRQFTLVERRL